MTSTDIVADTLGYPSGALAATMGITVTELRADHSSAHMRVAGNTQVTGRVHGGAYAVLAETLASLSANVHAGEGRVALGIELSASHVGGAASGDVHAECTAVSLGARITVHQVTLTDDDGRLLSTVRVTNCLSSSSKGRHHEPDQHL